MPRVPSWDAHAASHVSSSTSSHSCSESWPGQHSSVSGPRRKEGQNEKTLYLCVCVDDIHGMLITFCTYRVSNDARSTCVPQFLLRGQHSPGASDSKVLEWGTGTAIFRGAQDDANNRKPWVWWKRRCALWFGIMKLGCKVGCPHPKEPLRAHSWGAVEPSITSGPDHSPAAPAPAQARSGYQARGKRTAVGSARAGVEVELDQGEKGNPSTAGRRGVPLSSLARSPVRSCASEGWALTSTLSFIPAVLKLHSLWTTVALHPDGGVYKNLKISCSRKFLQCCLLCVPVSPRHFSRQLRRKQIL